MSNVHLSRISIASPLADSASYTRKSLYNHGRIRSQIERRGVRQEVVRGVHVEHELQSA